MSNDNEEENVQKTPYQEEGTSMGTTPLQQLYANAATKKKPTNNNDLRKEIEEEVEEDELDDEELLTMFDEEANSDLMKIGAMKNGQWNNESKSSFKDNKSKFILNGELAYKVRQKVFELKGKVSHLTKNGMNVGITTLFIVDPLERIKAQIKIALTANHKAICEIRETNKKGAAQLIRERIKLNKILNIEVPFEEQVIEEIKGTETGMWMIAAINESNEKLATIINQDFNYGPVNQLLNQTMSGGDGNTPKHTYDYMLGIGDGANTAIKMLMSGGKKITFIEFEKCLQELNSRHLDYSKMGEDGNLETQLSELKNDIYELELMKEDLSKQGKFRGLLETPIYFTTLLRKLGDTSNPTRSHANYTNNQVGWQMAYREAYQKNMKADNTVMLLSERQKYLEDLMIGVVTGGQMTKKKNESPTGNGGGGKPFALNTNNMKKKYPAYCGQVMRKGYCTRKGCKFEGMTKAEHEARLPCREMAKGNCRFKTNCRFAHPGDKYDESKPCVHRGTINNTNHDQGGAAEESDSE